MGSRVDAGPEGWSPARLPEDGCRPPPYSSKR